MSEPAEVRRVLASDARRVRGIRLEALRDSAAGIAFHETPAQAEEHSDEFWQDRTVAAALSDSAAQFIAEAGRDWVGTATVLLPSAVLRPQPGGRALLVAVYVRPSQRGIGVLDALVDAAAGWADDEGMTELALEVHVDNLRAQRAYARLGFTATGRIVAGPNGKEQEMIRTL